MFYPLFKAEFENSRLVSRGKVRIKVKIEQLLFLNSDEFRHVASEEKIKVSRFRVKMKTAVIRNDIVATGCRRRRR